MQTIFKTFVFIFLMLPSLCLAQSEKQKQIGVSQRIVSGSLITSYQKQLIKKSSQFEIQVQLAESFRLSGDYISSAKWYGKVVKHKNATTLDKLNYVQMLLYTGNLNQANKWLTIARKEIPEDHRIKLYEKHLENLRL